MKSPHIIPGPTPQSLRLSLPASPSYRSMGSELRGQVQRIQSLTTHSGQKTCKSFVALLLPHLFAVSPLLHYSYKKIGGGGPALRSLRDGGVVPATNHSPLATLPLTTSLFYHLRKSSRTPQKDPNVFYHLRTSPRWRPKKGPMFSITYRPCHA